MQSKLLFSRSEFYRKVDLKREAKTDGNWFVGEKKVQPHKAVISENEQKESKVTPQKVQNRNYTYVYTVKCNFKTNVLKLNCKFNS